MKERRKLQRLNYRNDAPYPELKITCKNEGYADILLEDYSGSQSEFTAMNQYTYHGIVNVEVDERIVYHLEQIANVERFHLQLLGKLIWLLGAYPTYCNGMRCGKGFWSGKDVAYGRSLYEQLQLDLEMEYLQIRNYNTHICLIHDPFIKDILKRLVLDEEEHVKVLKELINSYYR